MIGERLRPGELVLWSVNLASGGAFWFRQVGEGQTLGTSNRPLMDGTLDTNASGCCESTRLTGDFPVSGLGLLIVLCLSSPARGSAPCARCHPKETTGYEATPMAHALESLPKS